MFSFFYKVMPLKSGCEVVSVPRTRIEECRVVRKFTFWPTTLMAKAGPFTVSRWRHYYELQERDSGGWHILCQNLVGFYVIGGDKYRLGRDPENSLEKVNGLEKVLENHFATL